MKESVYIETTVISYLTSRPSRDLIVAAHQQVTREWWESVLPGRLHPVVSELVLDECSGGDATVAERRLEAVAELDVLPLSSDALELAETYRDILHLPENAAADSLHIALAVANRVDFLVTWNCRHIANGNTMRKLALYNRETGLHQTTICTPEELLEEPT